MDYSVVVVGGGPAGALAALKLAQAGARVLVVDRPRPHRAAAAEILAPEGRAILEREGLWSVVPPDFRRPCTAIAAAWSGPDPAWTSFGGPGSDPAWHLDRISFDAWLLRQIATAGVAVESGTVERVRRDHDGWQIQFRVDDAIRATSCRVLLLATGRAARGIPLAPRRRIDNLCLVAGTTTPDPVAPDALIVEATADGWWYSAPLVDGTMFTGWMTDLSLIGHGRYSAAAAASLERAPLHARRVGAARCATIIGSASWAMTPAAGPDWMAIGDAALARDPVGGDGLAAALHSAREGADLVIRAMNGDRSVWLLAADQADTIARQYEDRRLRLYRAAAIRWPDMPFWRRFAPSGGDGGRA